MYKTVLFLITVLIFNQTPIQANYNTNPTDSDITQTRAQVHTIQADTIDAATIDTDNLFCDEAEITTLTTQNATIQTLSVKHLNVNTDNKNKNKNKRQHIFRMRDFFRVGSSGFRSIRTIKNLYNFPNSPNSEIRGWKMTVPEDTCSDNAPLYVTDYITDLTKNQKTNVIIEAHFIMPKSDAPKDDIEEFIKLGIWLDCVQGQSLAEKPIPSFFESDDTLIPTKSQFGSSKIINFTVRIVIPSQMITDGLFYILLKRVAVSEDKIEFNHKQGIALNTLSIQYPI